MIGMSSRFQLGELVHQPTLGETKLAKIKLWKSQLLTYHGQKAKTLSWSEASLPRTWQIWIWEKKQLQVGDGSPVPRTLSIIYSGGVIKLSRLSHGPWFSSYPLKFRVQVQSFASLSRWEITPMSIMILSGFHGNHQPYFSIKISVKTSDLGHDGNLLMSSTPTLLRLNFRLPRKAAAWHDTRRFATAVAAPWARGWAPPAMR